MPNLEYLGLDDCNQISDFQYIDGIQKLKELHVARVNLDDQKMRVIGKLPELQTLGAAENHLSDITFTNQFPKLSQLGVQQNTIQDISSLPEGIEYSAIDQKIVLPDTAINRPQPLLLKDKTGQLPNVVNWKGQGALQPYQDRSLLIWTTSGNNSFDFVSDDKNFSGTVSQTVE